MLKKRAEQLKKQHAAVLRSQRLTKSLKKIFPALIVIIILLVFLWPQLKLMLVSRQHAVHEKVNAVRTTHEGELVNPHYYATNNKNEPFEIMAKSAHAMSTQEVSLTKPLGSLKLHSGQTVTLKADSGRFNQNEKVFSLNNNGLLSDMEGNIFHFHSAIFLISESRMYSPDPVYGMGPAGEMHAGGFEAIENGAIITLKRGNEKQLKFKVHSGEILTSQGDMTYDQLKQVISTQDHVRVTSPKGSMRADKMSAYLRVVHKKLELDRVEASGKVVVEVPDGIIQGNNGIYFPQSQKTIITGNVEIHRKNHIARGTEVEIDLRTGQHVLKSDGSQKGNQVRIILDSSQLKLEKKGGLSK